MTRGPIILKQAFVLVHIDSQRTFLIELLSQKLPHERCIVLFEDHENLNTFIRERGLTGCIAKRLKSPAEIFAYVENTKREPGLTVVPIGVCLDPIDTASATPEDYRRWPRNHFLEDLVK